MKKITENIYYTGSQHPDRKLFDQLIHLPDGTTYNSYVVVGSEKTALIDTVYPEKTEELIQKLDELGLKKIDYIISNHAEQDHSGSMPAVLEKYPDAIVVTNAKAKELLMSMLFVDENKIKVVEDNETLSLGDKTLKFMLTPWVHWPDTMFTYVVEDEALFTMDFMGSHYPSTEIFANSGPKLLEAAKRYYAEIIMPFRTFAAKYTAKVKEINPKLILPSHGPVYKDIDFIINAYEDWTSDKVKNQVVIPYVSMYNSTYELVVRLKKELEDKGVEVFCFDLAQCDLGEVAMALTDAATLVIGASMVLAGPHPFAVTAAYLINALRPKTKFFSIIGSYGWGGNLTGKIEELLNCLKTQKLEYVVVKGKPRECDFENIEKLAQTIVEKHKTDRVF